MLRFPSDPSPQALADLARVREALDQRVPAKHLDRNLLIATWNLRAFGGLTEKWQSAAGDSPKRDLHALALIAEIVSRFDVVALQEAKGTIKALRHMLAMLGPEWGLILTDTSGGPPGNDERLAYVYDTRRVKPSGLACELVVYLDPDQEVEASATTLDRQFARTPYAVSFISSGQTFILVTLHVLYGKKAADRIAELTGIANWLGDWAAKTTDYNQNLIALGDFNIDREGDPNYEAFVSRGLRPPPQLRGLPRTIFDKPDSGHFYDQIAWFQSGGRPQLTLNYGEVAGNFDFTELAFGGLTRNEISWRISDHFPLWAEFLAPQ